MSVLTDANARTGQRMEGCGDDESRVLGTYGRDSLAKDNAKQVLPFATNRKLALTNTFFSTRKGGILHTHNGTRPNDRERIGCILTYQAHRPRVHDVLHPPSRATADSGHNILSESVVILSLTTDRHERKSQKHREFDRQLFMSGEFGGPAFAQRFHDILDKRLGERGTLPAMERCDQGPSQKKDRTDCSTYRGCSLVAHAGEVLLKIVAARLSNYCETEGITPGVTVRLLPRTINDR